MKLLILPLSICFMMLSCGNGKNATAVNETQVEIEQVIDTTTESGERIRIVGTVHISDTGCKLYIDAKENDGSLFKLYPENLDSRFQVEGMFLKFYYDKTESELPTDCDAKISATLTDVTPLRK